MMLKLTNRSAAQINFFLIVPASCYLETLLIDKLNINLMISTFYPA